jgi:nucleotide-binding universal stress UspA family protein
MKFDKVLVPVDGSPISDIATEVAINSAKTFGAKLTFLNVVDFSSNMKFGSVENIDEILELQTEGQKATDRVSCKAKEAGLEYDVKIMQGVPWEVIVKLSKSYDQIILGVTGKGGIGGRIGKTVEKVIEESYCPVLTIKSGSRRMEEILLPVSNENNAAIDLAISSAKITGGRITVFAVRGGEVDAEAIANQVADRCKAAGVGACVKIGEGDPGEAIVAQSGMFDLVIMGTTSKDKGDVLHGGVTQNLILNSACPVTIVREF